MVGGRGIRQRTKTVCYKVHHSLLDRQGDRRQKECMDMTFHSPESYFFANCEATEGRFSYYSV